MAGDTKRSQGDSFDAKTEARIEEEVRKRVLALLSGAGLPEVDVAREVHYWMPQEFMEWYRDLFLKALKLEGRGMIAATRRNSEGEEVSVGDNPKEGVGKPKRERGESIEAFQERAAATIGVGHGGGGKKYKLHYTIQDEEAFKLKKLVDRRLMEMTQGIGLKARDTKRGRGARNS
jgi:hypothetical protein